MRHAIAVTLLTALLLLPAENAFCINWLDDYDKAMIESKSSGKPVMVEFYTQWCTWCKKLDSDTFTDVEVACLSEQFVCAKIDAEKNKPLVLKYTVRGYPTILFLDAAGQASKVVSGYLPPSQFVSAMKVVLASAGKTVEPPRIITRIVEPVFRLTGIVLGQNTAKAMINGVSVVEGDIIQGAKVVQITTESVVLMAQGRRLCLEVDKK